MVYALTMPHELDMNSRHILSFIIYLSSSSIQRSHLPPTLTRLMHVYIDIPIYTHLHTHGIPV